MKLFGRKRPGPLERVRLLGDLDAAIGRAEQPVPAGSLIYTPAGRKSHVKSALTEGAECRDLKDWPGPWFGTANDAERERAASLPLCPRCAAATGIQAASQEAS
jgi:hypothetical protein